MKLLIPFLLISGIITSLSSTERDLNAHASLGFPIKPKLGIEINSYKWKFIGFNHRLCYMFNQKDTTRTITIFNSKGDSIGTENEKWENNFGGISYSFIPKFNITNMFFIGAGLSSEAYMMILKKKGFEVIYSITWIADMEYRYKMIGCNFYCTKIPHYDFEIGFGFSVLLRQNHKKKEAASSSQKPVAE